MRIPINLNDYHEPTIAPVGKYNLIIAGVEQVETAKAKKPQYRISIGFEEFPQHQNITHYIGIPGEKDEPGAMAFKALLLKRFLALFRIPIPTNGIDTEALGMQMVGAKASAAVELDKERDEFGVEKPEGRVFNRLVVPRLREEASVSGGEKQPKTPPKR